MSIESASAEFTKALVALVGEAVSGATPAAAPKTSGKKGTTKEAAAPAESGPSAKQVADAVIALADTTTRDIAVDVLKQFKAGRVAELKPEDYAKVLVAVAKAKAQFEAAKEVAPASNDSLV